MLPRGSPVRSSAAWRRSRTRSARPARVTWSLSRSITAWEKSVAQVSSTRAGDVREQESGADAEFEDALGRPAQDAFHGGVAPVPHLVERDRLAGEGAVPAGEVLTESVSVVVGVGLVVDLLPLQPVRRRRRRAAGRGVSGTT